MNSNLFQLILLIMLERANPLWAPGFGAVL